MLKPVFRQLLFLISLSFILSLPALAASNELNKKLFEAVQYQDVLQIKALLGQAADPNYKEQNRPLIGWAAQNGNTEVAEILLQAKANPNLTDAGNGHSPLIRAIEMQQIGMVNLLLKYKADPNYKTGQGKTCLDFAVESKKADIVESLVKAGADVKSVAADGGSPALTAAEDGTPESMQIIRILGKAGANLNSSNAAYTPLSYAVEQNNLELVKTLLEAGANPDIKVKGSNPPIYYAIDKKEILELLLNAKANPNLEDGYGSPVLFAAIDSGNRDAAELLLNAGADINKKNSAGTSVLDYADQSSQTEIAALLRDRLPAEKGANSNQATDISSANCTIADAAKKQMALHGLLQKQVDAGKMSNDIFRTFNEDTKEYADLLVNNPPAACKLLDRLQVKYGL